MSSASKPWSMGCVALLHEAGAIRSCSDEDDTNVGSIRTIEHNHGILEQCVLHDGIWKRRYWIDLAQVREY